MPEQIENRMVVDSQWDEHECVDEDKEEGYYSTINNEFVEKEYAYEYALDCCLHGSDEQKEEFKKMLVEWFYSGGDWREA